MRILEINGFMTWALSYEGAHKVERWMPRHKRGVYVAHDHCWWRNLVRGFSLLRQSSSGQWDLIVCAAFGRSYGKSWFHRHLKSLKERLIILLVRKIHSRAGCPLAVVDISDDQTVHPVNEQLLDSCAVFFKRELPLDVYHSFDSFRGGKRRSGAQKDRRQFAERGWPQKMQPITLGCREKEPDMIRIPISEKKWDVFYSGNNEDKPRRNGIDEALKQLRDLGYRVYDSGSPLELDEYLEVMRNSRLALSPPGLGWDCHRHYEASMLGTVAVMPYPVIQRISPLLNGKHCLFYDPEKSLLDQLKMMLEDHTTLDAISKQAQIYSAKNHTHQAIFNSVVKRLFLEKDGTF